MELLKESEIKKVTNEITLTKQQSLGKFTKIHHFNDLFNMIHEFIGDIKTFIALVNINKYFRKQCKFSPKIIEVIKKIKKEKYSMFSPYSWISSTQYFYSKKTKFQEEYDLNEYEFKILFNLSKRMINNLDFETFEVNSTFNDVLDNYFYNQNGVKFINFSHCKFKENIDISRIIEFVGRCYNVEKVKFEDNLLSYENCDRIKICWSKLKCLKEVNLSGCKIGSVGASKKIAKLLKQNQSITHINLSLNKLETVGLNALSKLISFSNLKYLYLGNNSSLGGFSEFFANLSEINNLTDLYLNALKFNNDDCIPLTKFLLLNKTLKFLSLYDNKITSVGFTAVLVSLTENKTLERIDFSNNSLLREEKYVEKIMNHFLEILPKLSLDEIFIQNIGIIPEKIQEKIIKDLKMFMKNNNLKLIAHTSYNNINTLGEVKETKYY